MATNFELKARIPSLETSHEQARRLGAAFDGVLEQRDTYFRVLRGRLKLRECAGKTPELIFYEREESSGERWSKYERLPVGGEAGGLAKILNLAGGILAVVEKTRSLYLYRNARIHLDDVAGLGSFLEFEIVGGESPESYELMRVLRGSFSIREEMIFRGSYCDMIVAKTPEKTY